MKTKDSKLTQGSSNADSSYTAWVNFRQVAERFEKQRIACDSGLAFAFMEGALVDAIRTGKWYVLSTPYTQTHTYAPVHHALTILPFHSFISFHILMLLSHHALLQDSSGRNKLGFKRNFTETLWTS